MIWTTMLAITSVYLLLRVKAGLVLWMGIRKLDSGRTRLDYEGTGFEVGLITEHLCRR